MYRRLGFLRYFFQDDQRNGKRRRISALQGDLMTCTKQLVVGLLVWLTNVGLGQEPVDLFSDSPSLAEGFVRIGAWNVRHLNVADNSERFFGGRNREEDFSILISSFAKAVLDLKLDLLVLV